MKEKIIKSGEKIYISQSVYDHTHKDFKGVWTTERWDTDNWEHDRKKYIGKRTWMPPYDLLGKTCLLVEGQGFEIVPDDAWKAIRNETRGYSRLGKVIEMSPQTQHCPEDIGDYEYICDLYESYSYKEAMNYMGQWDDFNGCAEYIDEIDEYEEVLTENKDWVLTRCPSKHFGWQGDAFFLYHKDNNE